AFTVVLLFVQVIMRYVFNNSLTWSEELARYIFIWQIWLGASLGLRERKHIRVELILGFLKGRGRDAIELLGTIVWFILCLFLVVSGTDLCLQLMAKNAASPALRIPYFIIYASLPVSCAAICLRLLGQMFSLCKAVSKGEGGNA
ncbi:MAG: TRAP transporter small permease, partial [Clostridia bacterium]|nr:TRAP transporter small permease [Clostridia bacterium]